MIFIGIEHLDARLEHWRLNMVKTDQNGAPKASNKKRRRNYENIMKPSAAALGQTLA